MRRAITREFVLAATLLTAASMASAGSIGPSPYLGFTDSPFNGVTFAYFHLEDFEDGALNTPGVSLATAGWTIGQPGLLTDSVDADDNDIDGIGSSAHSFYSGNVNTSLTIFFDAAALGGNLPTHAGIVWTDVGEVTSGTLGFGDVTLELLDAGGQVLDSLLASSLGDGAVDGATAEDRFLGFIEAGGIAGIRISMSNSVDWEVDHLQYGFAPRQVVPEPSTLVPAALAGVGLLVRARRRSRH